MRVEGTVDLDTFKKTLRQETPPRGLSLALQALWHQARGDWDRAHGLAQAQHDGAGAWVHAHLHRVEGDAGNAGYWYRRAGRSPSQASLEVEWEEIGVALLKAPQ